MGDWVSSTNPVDFSNCFEQNLALGSEVLPILTPYSVLQGKSGGLASHDASMEPQLLS